MSTIQFYYHQHSLQPKPRVRYHPELRYDALLTPDDRAEIARCWDQHVERGNTRSETLGTLWSTQGGIYDFHSTTYREYFTIGDPEARNALSPATYQRMHIGAIGAAVETADGAIVVQRRAQDIHLAPGLLDSSAAGLCSQERHDLNPETAVRDRLQGELGIAVSDIETLTLTGVYGAPEYCSGMFAYSVRTSLTAAEIEARRSRTLVAELVLISKKTFPEFLKAAYLKREMIDDGCATFLVSLSAEEFLKAIFELREQGAGIAFGELRDGEFIRRLQDSSP